MKSKFDGNLVNGDGRILQITFPSLEILAAGVYEGHEVVHKFGRIAAATVAWQNVSDLGGLIPFTGVDLVTPILVSSAADTQDIEIYGVDGDWNPVMYTVTLNGLVDVTIPGSIMTVYRMINVGSTNLAGDVSLIDRGDANAVYAKILDGGNLYNQTQMAWMPIPAGYIAVVTTVGASSAGGKSTEMAYRIKPFGEAFKIKRITDIIDQVSQNDIYYVFDEKQILDVICKADVGGNSVSASFDVVFIKKDVFERKYGDIGKYVTL